ncbi:MAG TPA: adenosine kinase [Acidimicrobiales bacterium]|nr:adenosine kinase [Acidimicrobiales bacterium]
MTDLALDVLTIGNAIVDVLSQVEEHVLDEHGLVKGSMRLCSEEEAAAVYAAMGPAVEISGGSAANTAVGVASFGGRAAFVGKVRDDQLGDVFAHDIRASGVAFDARPAADGPPTGRCLILISPDAQRTMSTFLGTAGLLGPDDVRDDQVASAGVTYLEGYLWEEPSAKAAIQRAVAAAHAAGRSVAFTLSDSFCVERNRAEFLALVESSVDVLFANEAELTSLYGSDDFDACLEQVRRSVALAAVTRGAAGSVLVTPDRLEEIGAEPVEVVDTTGAGDLYAAGVLYGLAAGHDLAVAGRLGAVAAGEIISHVGARPEVSLAELAADVLSHSPAPAGPTGA